MEQGSFSPPAETTSLSSAELSLNDAVVEVAKRAGMEAARVATNELLREVRKDQSKPPAAAQLRTIKQFAEECPAFSEAALYKLVARSETNRLEEYGAIRRMGRKILIDLGRFDRWLQEIHLR